MKFQPINATVTVFVNVCMEVGYSTQSTTLGLNKHVLVGLSYGGVKCVVANTSARQDDLSVLI